MLLSALLVSLSGMAQISNSKTVTIKVNGNCAMCQSTIEKSGNHKNTAKVSWDKTTKMATITYDSNKTNTNDILKRIALAGYDNEQFLAPDAVYAKLPECCRYERDLNPVSKLPQKTMEGKREHAPHHGTSAAHDAGKETNQLKAVFDHYFSLKDALVNTDSKAAAAHANALLKSLKDVDMAQLPAEEHRVWMQVMKDLISEAEKLAAAKDIAGQRASFALLSNNMYTLSKVSRLSAPIYYQHCPMYAQGKGGQWLSRENTVKNPYYGARMLTCGKMVETIQ